MYSDKNQFSVKGPEGEKTDYFSVSPIGPTGADGAPINPSSFWAPTMAEGPSGPHLHKEHAKKTADLAFAKLQTDKMKINSNASSDSEKASALYNQGLRLRYGWGVPKNPSLAIENYHQASKCGHAGACYELVRLYLSGDVAIGVPENLVMAKSILNDFLNRYQQGKIANNIEGNDDNIENLKGMSNVIAFREWDVNNNSFQVYNAN